MGHLIAEAAAPAPIAQRVLYGVERPAMATVVATATVDEMAYMAGKDGVTSMRGSFAAYMGWRGLEIWALWGGIELEPLLLGKGGREVTWISLVKVRLTDLLAYYRSIIHTQAAAHMRSSNRWFATDQRRDTLIWRRCPLRSLRGPAYGWHLATGRIGRPRAVPCVAGAPSPLEESIMCLLTAITMAPIDRQLALA